LTLTLTLIKIKPQKSQKKTQMNYTISELASEFDITTRTIRFYEEKGLLNPKREGNARIYNSAERTKLRLILRGKRLGFTLEESNAIIEIYNQDKGSTKQLEVLLKRISEKRLVLQAQLNDIEALMLDLDGAEARCIESLRKLNLKKAS